MKGFIKNIQNKLSVVRGGTGAITLTALSLILLLPLGASARTIYQGDGLVLSISENRQEVTATWEDSSNGSLLLGANKLENGFATLRMLSPSAYDKVAISGTGEDKVAISGTGEGKVAISGTGENKVAISGTGEGKVAISGTGEGKSKFESASLEIFVSGSEIYGMLTVAKNNEIVEHVFDFADFRGAVLAEFRMENENTNF